MAKETTIYDLAKQLHLSPATISRGLKNNKRIGKETIKKIHSKAAEMGYRHNSFASSLRKQKSHTIGVLVHQLNSHFITSVLAGIEKVTSTAGYDILIAHSGEDYQTEIANAINLFHKRVDGLIASLSFNTRNLDHFNLFFEKNIPVVFFDRVDEKSDKTHVIIDNYKSGYAATQHLLRQGCRRIVLLTADLSSNVYAQRHRGYTDALFDAGVAYETDYVFVSNLNEQSGLDAAHAILKMNPMPDGIFSTNDFNAAVCMQELRRTGIHVPEDIAIVGFNNDAISKIMEPQLTTINYPGKEMGEITALSLINNLKGITSLEKTNQIIINSELIVRTSSLRKKENID
jgi:LacI family transcriptional regulator